MNKIQKTILRNIYNLVSYDSPVLENYKNYSFLEYLTFLDTVNNEFIKNYDETLFEEHIYSLCEIAVICYYNKTHPSSIYSLRYPKTRLYKQLFFLLNNSCIAYDTSRLKEVLSYSPLELIYAIKNYIFKAYNRIYIDGPYHNQYIEAVPNVILDFAIVYLQGYYDF